MTQFDKMEQNFVALTEEELVDVNGGESWVRTVYDWYTGFRRGLGFGG